MIVCRPRLLPMALCLVVTAFLTGCGPKDAPYPPDTQPGLSLLHSAVKKDPGGKKSIVGTIRNDSGNSYGYVQVEFNLYDKSGHGLGATLTKTSHLGPGQTWNFQARVLKKEAYRYTVDDVTGY